MFTGRVCKVPASKVKEPKAEFRLSTLGPRESERTVMRDLLELNRPGLDSSYSPITTLRVPPICVGTIKGTTNLDSNCLTGTLPNSSQY